MQQTSVGRDNSRPALETDNIPKGYLNVFDIISIVVGSIIGSAIFVVPGTIASLVASPTIVFALWVIGGVLALCGVLSLTELGTMFPGTGGIYRYLREAYGPLLAFLYGWALLAVIHSGSIAALSVGASLYMSRLVMLGPVGQKVVAVTGILLLTAVNCIGLRTGKYLQNVLSVAKVGGIVAMIIILLGFGYRSAPSYTTRSRIGVVPLGISLVAVLWTYEGWHVVSFAAGEMRNIKRDLFRGLFYGTLVVCAVYLLANASYYKVLSPSDIAKTDTVAATAMRRTAGLAAGLFVSALIVVSVVGALNGMILTGPRVYYAMGRDGSFLKSFGCLSPRFHTPVLALAVQGVWSCFLVLSGSYEQLFANVIFTAWIFYGFAVAAVVKFRHQRPQLERPFRVPLSPFIPGIFCLSALVVVITSMAADPLRSSLGLGFLLTGIPAYFCFQRKAQPPQKHPGARLRSHM